MVYRIHLGLILGLYRDNGKENGKYYLVFSCMWGRRGAGVQGLGACNYNYPTCIFTKK